MRSRERPVLPRFHGVLKTQPKATEIKVTFVQLGGGVQEARQSLRGGAVEYEGAPPAVSPIQGNQERKGQGLHLWVALSP